MFGGLFKENKLRILAPTANHYSAQAGPRAFPVGAISCYKTCINQSHMQRIDHYLKYFTS